jgi:hypothetical protein
MLDLAEKSVEDKRNSLFWQNINDEEKSSMTMTPEGQSYKTFYVRNLQIFIIS